MGDIAMELHLPTRASSARHGRQWVLARLPTPTDARTVQVVELLVSEVVTNAVKYGEAPDGVRLTMHVGGGHVTIAVSDASSARPVVRHPAPTEPGGRGVQLVDHLADEWGVTAEGSRKTVWFRVTLGPTRGETTS